MKPENASSRPLAVVALTLLLAACASAPYEPPTSSSENPAAAPSMPDDAVIQTFASPLAGLFTDAEAALDAGEWMLAEQALPIAAAESSPSNEFMAYSALIRARIAWLRGDLQAFHADIAAAPTDAISDDVASRLLLLQSLQARLEGDYLSSAQLGNAALSYYPPGSAQSKDLAYTLWRDLQHIDPANLARIRAADPRLRPWVERLKLIRAWDYSAASIGRADSWAQRYPGHPASALALPSAESRAPRHLALLLPLSGRLAVAASAVRDGFLAAYYSETAPRPQLTVLDTGGFDSPTSAYRAALAAGADLVVGPLTKQAVTEIMGQPRLEVPLLALNRSSQPAAEPWRGLQFALAPEDEAQTLASHALGAGYRRALLLRPEGEWGDKMAHALTRTWTSGGGTIAASGRFASRESHSATIEAALDLDESATRGRALRLLIDTDMVLSGRRRQDLDVVLMLTPSTEDAKSLKPLLAYHYAGDLPVYATSSANSAELWAGDKDLTGLNLVEIPWLLGRESELRDAIKSAALRGAGLSRLQALGVDAYRLAERYQQLEPVQGTVVSGATGYLTVNPRGELVRELPLARFASGGLTRP